jgi:hypothetical protein
MEATTTRTTVAVPDNGYFIVLARPCGHQVRVRTEDHQWSRRHGDKRTYRAVIAAAKARLATTACPTCQEATA